MEYATTHIRRYNQVDAVLNVIDVIEYSGKAPGFEAAIDTATHRVFGCRRCSTLDLGRYELANVNWWLAFLPHTVLEGKEGYKLYFASVRDDKSERSCLVSIAVHIFADDDEEYPGGEVVCRPRYDGYQALFEKLLGEAYAVVRQEAVPA